MRGTVAHRGDRATEDVANNMLRELARYSRYQAAHSRGDRNGSYRERVRDRRGFERQESERERELERSRGQRTREIPMAMRFDRSRTSSTTSSFDREPPGAHLRLSDVHIMGFRWSREIGIRRMLLCARTSPKRARGRRLLRRACRARCIYGDSHRDSTIYRTIFLSDSRNRARFTAIILY